MLSCPKIDTFIAFAGGSESHLVSRLYEETGANTQICEYENLITQEILTIILLQTISGNGPDNHLMGLREMARRRFGQDEMECALFREKAYKEYLNFRLSTSQLPSREDVIIGYGAVVPDGYGVSYNPCPQQITFCISSFYSCPETSSDFFARSLEGSLLQMREVCLKIRKMTEKDN